MVITSCEIPGYASPLLLDYSPFVGKRQAAFSGSKSPLEWGCVAEGTFCYSRFVLDARVGCQAQALAFRELFWHNV
jgi:hypothetical protein